MAYIELQNCYKEFKIGDSTIVANNFINLQIEKGELVVILGTSGAGKSTILNILGGMYTPDDGKVIIDNKDIANFSDNQLTLYRKEDVGFVFQFYNLIANLTAKENIELATDIIKDPIDAKKALTVVGLQNKFNNFPSQLSGGEQQRVSIARAIAKRPKILLCDEPTGALDYNTGKQVLHILQTMAKHGVTVVIVTHNSLIANIANKVVHMKDAQIQSIEVNKNPQSVLALEW